MPSVASQFPVTFANGVEWRVFRASCTFCQAQLANSFVRGQVKRLSKSVVHVEALGLCEACQKATSFDVRFSDDMRMSGPQGGGWKSIDFDRYGWRRLFLKARLKLRTIGI